MFARTPGAGSLYWLSARDNAGAYLDGTRSYTLQVPQPVPAKLFWSLTVYDARTRSEIRTSQGRAALRSMFELAGIPADQPVRLHFSPRRPADGTGDAFWIQTNPGAGWFTYFRIYGPETDAFDGTWQLPDFEPAL
jgi:hypothetical protein